MGRISLEALRLTFSQGKITRYSAKVTTWIFDLMYYKRINIKAIIAHASIIASGTAVGLLVRELLSDKESRRTYAILATTLTYFAFKVFEKFLRTPFYIQLSKLEIKGPEAKIEKTGQSNIQAKKIAKRD